MPKKSICSSRVKVKTWAVKSAAFNAVFLSADAADRGPIAENALRDPITLAPVTPVQNALGTNELPS